jgi:hypothetical protein
MTSTTELRDAHPAAKFCDDLTIGGFTDWYLPSLLELDIAYFNLKPNTAANNTNWGTNIYAIPQRNSNWSATYPTQTAVTAFNTSAEAFVALAADLHWSSTQISANAAWSVYFNTGDRFGGSGNKPGLARVRAFRRIAL